MHGRNVLSEQRGDGRLVRITPGSLIHHLPFGIASDQQNNQPAV
jgi:hypothetical protein